MNLDNCVLHNSVLLLELHTDQGRNFESNLFVDMCKQLKINKTRITELRQQSDGTVEEYNRARVQHLSKVVDGHQEDWDHHIPLFMLPYRSVINETTQHTPAKLMFGHKLRLPCDLKFRTSSEKLIRINEFAMEMRNRPRRTYKIVRNQLRFASDQMRTHYDIPANSPGYAVGDYVWLYNAASLFSRVSFKNLRYMYMKVQCCPGRSSHFPFFFFTFYKLTKLRYLFFLNTLYKNGYFMEKVDLQNTND